ASTPIIPPKVTYHIKAWYVGGGISGIPNIGSCPNINKCMAAPVAQANATGIIDRGENSNSNSSTANKTAATGVPKIAAIPAVAPAVSIILRSFGVIFMICPAKEPKAPPVEIIGPSEPNGPPDPIEIAADKGFKIVIIGLILLSLVNTCSIASGIP